MKSYLKAKIESLVKYLPVPAMSVDNLYAYLDALYHTRSLPGPVVEVGCAAGGTSAFACRFLSAIGCGKPYYCIDTFSGFVKEQLATDHRLGLTPDHDSKFGNVTVRRLEGNLLRWGIRSNVHIIKGDICTMDDSLIPQDVSVALMDVDLRDPTYAGLQKIYPKLAPGGIILVDDCRKDTSWVGADSGYLDFVKYVGLRPRYYFGLGVIEKVAEGCRGIPWQVSESPNPAGDAFYS
jgi:O-methyltransferase